MMKKLVCLFLVMAMVVSVLSGGVLAAGALPRPELEGTARAERLFADGTQGPTLSEGTHPRWFDRLGQLPQYAVDFYGWLEDNRDAGEALADPTVAQVHKDAYVYELTVVPGTVSYTYGIGEDPGTKAQEAVVVHASEAFDVAMAYGVAVFVAFDRDHPEVFWLTGDTSWAWSLEYSYRNDGGTGTATYSMRVMLVLQQGELDIRQLQYCDPEAVAQGIGRLEGYVEEHLEQIPAEAPVSEQLRQLNRALTTGNSYNVYASTDSSYAPWESISALSGGEDGQGPVCEGYARAFKVLCDRLGIGCTLVEGQARATADGATQPHMWNYVQVGDCWYAVDVTWNDPAIDPQGDPAVSGRESEDWFLLGADSPVAEDLTFLQSHPVENVATTDGLAFVNGPELSPVAYDAQYMDITPYRTGEVFTAPEAEGKVFAGWYEDEALTRSLSPDRVTGWAYARFVDRQLLSVRFQITSGTTAQSASTDLRLLTAVDSLDYRAVSFQIGLADAQVEEVIDRVYQQVRAGDRLIAGPEEIFGAEAAYFATYTLQNVPRDTFAMEFRVVPRWQTMDGTWVDGVTRTFQIADHC